VQLESLFNSAHSLVMVGYKPGTCRQSSYARIQVMANGLIEQAFNVDDLSVDQLLVDWRWLLPGPFSLIACNVFGDLFLRNAEGAVFWLQVGIGKLSEVAASESQFLDLLKQDTKREVWFAETDAQAAAGCGLHPSKAQCIGFKIPLVFTQSKDAPDNAYVADLYEQVSFLGDLHRQIANAPDGTQVRLRLVR
jgi:hypothetical protein